MNQPIIHTAGGSEFKLPMFDPVVAGHFANASSYTDTLLKEINGGLYSRLFANRKDLIFLDIGSNIGLVSIYASDACKRIIAVEPAKDTFAALKAITLKCPQIECVNAALAPEDGECEFFVNGENTTASSTVNTFGTRTVVPGLSLTSILSIYQLEQVDVCKADCEGGEVEGLSFEELERAASIVRTWFIETHNIPGIPWEKTMTRLLTDLNRLGYTKQTINGMALLAE